jgi:predicted RecA/RadA family phage recombinase
MRIHRFSVLTAVLVAAVAAVPVVTTVRSDAPGSEPEAGLVAADTAIARKYCHGNPARRAVTVSHGPVTPVTVIDNGTPGDSAGDERIFAYGATDDRGRAVHVDWLMTTTGVDFPEAGLQTRVNNGIFSWPDVNTQMTLNGVGVYRNSGSVLATASTLDRPLVGGSGEYAGANGWVLSDHLVNGDWTHTFYFCK